MILLGLAVKPVTYLCRQCNPLVKSGTHVPYRTFVLVLLRTEQSVSLLPKSTSEYQTNGRGANEGINGLLFLLPTAIDLLIRTIVCFEPESVLTMPRCRP